MPLRDGQTLETSLVPPTVQAAQKIWLCRYTGALYQTYEEYLKVISSHRQRVWGCKHTGAANLSFEEALASEAKVQSILDQFPDCYEEAVIKLVHHATLKEDELSQRVVSYFKDRFVVGESVFGIRDGQESTCKIVAAMDPATAGHDSQTISTATFILPPDPDDEYRVEWSGDSGVSVLKRHQLIRQKVPLTRAVFKSWLHLNAVEEPVAGMKGIPCIWKANEKMRERFQLPTEIPHTLEERMERIQQRKEQSRRTTKNDYLRMEEYGEEDQAALDDYEAEIPLGRNNSSLRGRSSTYASAAADTPEVNQDGKVEVPVETIDEVRARLQPGSVKRVLLDALEEAGPSGLNIGSLVDAVQGSGVKSWESQRSANSSIAAMCAHDLAFLRTGTGHFVLRAFKRDTMHVPVPASAKVGGEDSVAQRPSIERNNFKCPKCHKAHHPDNSPLLLCDSCPRSYHLTCLDLTFEELPEDDWQCPKCLDRRAGVSKRGASSQLPLDGHQRGSFQAEYDKEERLALKALKRERDRKQGDDRLSKEQQLQDQRFNRERARYLAKWAALHPLDDLEILDDEEDALAAAETEAQVASEEVAKALRRADPKPDGRSKDRVARLQRKAREAADRSVALRLIIEGPQAVQDTIQNESSKTALYDALAIVDFITIFGASFEAAPLTLLEVQQMAAYPLETKHLSSLYIALLRCLLLEAMGMEGVVRSRARRWARVIDDSTWPEILRRYLLASRTGLAVPADLQKYDSHTETGGMDDHFACIVGAKLLSEMPYHMLSWGLQLRILAALCNDVADCATLRNEISARVEEMSQLQTQFRLRQVEDRKRLKVEISKPAEAKTEQAAGKDKGAASKEAGQEGDKEAETGDVEQKGTAEGMNEEAGGPKQEGVPGDGDMPNPAGDDDPDVSTESDENRPGKDLQQAESAVPEQPPSEVQSKAEPSGRDGQAGAQVKEEQPEEKAEEKAASTEAEQSKDVKEEQVQEEGKQPVEGEQAAAEKGTSTRPQRQKKKKRQKGPSRKKTEEVAQLQAQERVYEEELREREAALDEALDARAIRGECLGQDRHFRRYWWYPGEQSVVFVEESEGTSIGTMEAPEELSALMERLNPNGLREKALLDSLAKKHDNILGSLGYHAVNLDIEHTPRPFPDKETAEMVSHVDTSSLQSSLKKLHDFLDQLDSIPASPVEATVADWKARLDKVDSRLQLATVILELEADVNELGSGLPSGADDASLAGFGKQRRVTQQQPGLDKHQSEDLHAAPSGSVRDSQEANGMHLPPGEQGNDLLPPLQTPGHASITPFNAQRAETSSPGGEQSLHRTVDKATDSAGAGKIDAELIPNGVGSHLHISGADENRHESNQQAASTAAPGVLIREGNGEDDSAVTPASGPNRQQTVFMGGPTGDSSQPAECDPNGSKQEFERYPGPLDPIASVQRLFKPSDMQMPTDVIGPPDELDASDSEASKNRRGGTLWRSARERKAWLKDARRALESQDVSCAAYVASILVDRAQPLLRSLQRASKRAEKEAAEYDALDTGPVADEGTPVPPSTSERATKQAPRTDRAGSMGKSRKAKRGAELNGRASARGDSLQPPSKKARASQLSQAASVEDLPMDGDLPDGHVSKQNGVVKHEEDRWDAACQVCGEDGDLLRCDAPDCSAAQHVACAGLDEEPEAEWYCAAHRNKPSVKRRRSASVRSSAEPQSAPSKPGLREGGTRLKPPLLKEAIPVAGSKGARKRRR